MSGAHEFRIHHHVSELMKLLGVSRDGPGAEVYTSMLQKNMTPYITTQVSAHNAKRKIAENTQTPVDFLQKYDELKAKNNRDLDPIVFLLSKLCDDEQARGYLYDNAAAQAEAAGVSLQPPSLTMSQLTLPPSSGTTKVTPEELEKLKAQLSKVTSEKSDGPSEAMKAVLKMERPPKHVGLPVHPDWMYTRPHLTWDFVDVALLHETGMEPLGGMSLHNQEQAIIEDLLASMQGREGKYISCRPLTNRFAPREFAIDSSADPSLRELARRVLPLCSNYSTLVRFIEEKSAFEYGLVNHALSAAMRNLLKDYNVLVAQLEEQLLVGDLSLQKLWFYIQPTMRSVEIFASIATQINKGECIGGTVLSLLHEKTANLIGDAKGQELCLYLTQSACVPYFEILEKWIYKGIIRDPYREFLVEENEKFNKEKLQEDYNDAYWEQHYTICRERIPLFLERVADKVLNTGKYLNVVRQCGRDVRCPVAEEMVYTIKERHYFDQIEKAYAFASRLVLDLLMGEQKLPDRLKSIKHYFLLDQGDFIQQFMDMADDEMRKKMDEIMPTRLESLLELALRCSTANIDPYKDDLRVDLLPYDLTTQLFKVLSIDTKREKEYRMDPTDLNLSGLEAFSFDYIVRWPVSLVLNRKVLIRYQMLFRHLFYSKHVERQLCGVWQSNKTAKLYALRSARWYAAAFALRQRMLNFVQNFENYMMFEVIEPHWLTFQANLDTVENIDDVLSRHTEFLENCLKDCMLINQELLKTVTKLMMVCVTFSNFIQRLSQSTSVDYQESKLTTQSATLQAAQTQRQRKEEPQSRKMTTKVAQEHTEQLAGSENFERTIANFDHNFTRHLRDLLEQILALSTEAGYSKLINLIYRLDFNGFYLVEQLGLDRSARSESMTSSGN